VHRRRPKTLRSRCRSPAEPAAAQSSSLPATTTALHPSALADPLTRIEPQLSLRKKNQSNSSPMRAKTMRTATRDSREAVI
jgi:hypothetical protein